MKVKIVRGGPWGWNDGKHWERWRNGQYRGFNRGGYRGFDNAIYAGEFRQDGDELHPPKNWDGTLPETDGTVEWVVEDSGRAKSPRGGRR
jgi:hypothetical protein